MRDANKIRLWRNSQIEVLRQSKRISFLEQYKYFWRILRPSMNEKFPLQILFSVRKNKSLIAYGGMVHIDWESRKAEFSFLHCKGDTAPDYEETLKDFLEVIRQGLCPQTGIHFLTTETFPHRLSHIALLESLGFVRSPLVGTCDTNSVYHQLPIPRKII